MKTKICPRCHSSLPPASFYADRAQPDGRSVYCRDCAYKLQRGSHDRRRIARMLNACKREIPDKLRQMTEEMGVHLCTSCKRWFSYGHFYHAASHRSDVCRYCADAISTPPPKSRSPRNKMTKQEKLTVEAFNGQFLNYCGGLLPEHCLPPTEEEGA